MTLCFQDNSPVFSKSSDRSRQSATSVSNQTPFTPYPTNMPAGMPPYPLTSNTGPQAYQNYPSPYPSYSGGSSSQSNSMVGTVDATHLKDSMLSAIGDKIRQRLREKLGLLSF